MSNLIASFAVLLCLGSMAAATESPYTGLESRPVKALSREQIDAYRAGEGMGFALAAELNRYPGPKHVLELASELGLSEAQHAATRVAFEAMKAKAVALGDEIVTAETLLDTLFAGGQISSGELSEAVETIAGLTGRLRLAHLEAHLRMVEILTEGQVDRYVTLRGYSDGSGHGGHHHDPSKHGRH